jgi:heme/copper-type cytochrome/quinol oxidase subunit 1
MAMTETQPEADAPPSPARGAEAEAREVVLGSGDHKTIGRLWIAVSSVMLVASLGVAAAAGFERIDLGSFAVVASAEMYAQLWSLAWVGVLVLGVVPLWVGIATYLVPLQVGACTLAFPRGAAAAFWCWLVAAGLLVASYVFNGGPGGGRQDFTVLWAVSLGIALMALAWALVCVVTTVIGLRTRGLTLADTPMASWSFLVFGTVGLLSLPMVVAELVVAYIRVRYGDLGDAVARVELADILAGVSLAPGVYWLAIPALGLLAEAAATHSERELARPRALMGLIAAFGFVAVGGHLLSFLTLRPHPPFDNAVMVLTLLAAPLVIIGVLGLAAASVRRGRLRFRVPLLGALVAGGLLLLASVVVVLGQVAHVVAFVAEVGGRPLEAPRWLQLTGTSYHDGVRVLVVGASLVAAVSALHHWGHKFYGRALDEVMGFLGVGALAAGSAIWALADVVSGMLEQPRDPFLTTAPRDGVEILNAIAMVGAVVAALGALVVVVNLALSTIARRGSATEPWRGPGLEWTTSSPPPLGNFPEPPVVGATADPDPSEAVAR